MTLDSKNIVATSTEAALDSEEDEDVLFRLEALRWLQQALSDLDRAIELGRGDTARVLLHRIQDVLQAPAIQDDSPDDR
jgi:hypothetical protein